MLNMAIDVREPALDAGCQEDSQINHPDIKYINESLANLVGFPEENCEPLHVVKYKGGQEYWPHNDFIENHKHMSCGGRITTMLVYLTDCADGGATNFPLLDVTIYPKPGTVVLWYNVLPTSDGRHVIVDQRMLHAGMPVGPSWGKDDYVQMGSSLFLDKRINCMVDVDIIFGHKFNLHKEAYSILSVSILYKIQSIVGRQTLWC